MSTNQKAIAKIIQKKGDLKQNQELLHHLKSNTTFERTPPCQHFTNCGGCELQHLSYTTQLKVKAEMLSDLLSQHNLIGEKCAQYDSKQQILEQIVPSPEEFGFRCRMKLHLDGEGVLGLYARGTREVIKINHCLILHPLLANCFTELSEIFSDPLYRKVSASVSVETDGKSRVVCDLS
jgi:23S rRNA (uracil1939-C5)-methyltransferase